MWNTTDFLVTVLVLGQNNHFSIQILPDSHVHKLFWLGESNSKSAFWDQRNQSHEVNIQNYAHKPTGGKRSRERKRSDKRTEAKVEAGEFRGRVWSPFHINVMSIKLTICKLYNLSMFVLQTSVIVFSVHHRFRGTRLQWKIIAFECCP